MDLVIQLHACVFHQLHIGGAATKEINSKNKCLNINY